MAQQARAAEVRNSVSEQEWQARVDLAAAYRLTAMFGWDDLVFTHISSRAPGPEHHFLINPYGMTFDEITASSLVKIDLDGNKVMDTHYSINPAGFTIHSAIHAAREDALCVMHTHTVEGVAVSAQESGLLPISQHALLALASVGYHDYEGLAVNDDEKPRLVADLGSKKALILRNHGLLTVGPSAADAFLAMYTLQKACTVQIMAQSGGGKLISVSPAVLAGMAAQAKVVTKGLGGELVWPGMLRKLDRVDPSYRD
ncbi:MAG TPA: class II aldolase/adducin family protein [Blastocatellia bacterium]|nr:class II aldolase/adducin family protein [Blastocatellia bacterium]